MQQSCFHKINNNKLKTSSSNDNTLIDNPSDLPNRIMIVDDELDDELDIARLFVISLERKRLKV